MDCAALIVPALVAGLGVWFTSFVLWTFSGLHTKDIRPLEDESGFMDDMKKHALGPGLYMWPNCRDRKDMSSDDFKARWKAGPWGTINVLHGQPNFQRNLIGSLAANVLIAFGIAVAISMVLGGVNGAEQLITCTWCQVFTPSLIMAACVYMLAPICEGLFMGKQTRFMVTSAIDGAIYAVITALLLTVLWPV
jgi:hypothetical protein